MTIIPRPQRLVPGEGQFAFAAETAIASGSGAEEVAASLAALLRQATALPLPVSRDASGSSVIRIHIDKDVPHEEGYRLTVTPAGVTLTARSAAGLFWATQSLLQLFDRSPFGSPAAGKAAWTLPAVHIEDQPRFAWRDVLLDSARHFMPVPFVKRLIDLMAIYKLNVLHWHLTDDQGWRLEIRKYPRLTEVGAWRSETLVGHLHDTPHRYDGVRHGGYYSQDEVRAIVAYASERHITVVPEIDMPGHMQAAIAAHPELGNLAEPIAVARKWGISEHVLNGREETIRFMEDVLDEVLELFPGPYIHIGGDECPKTEWRQSAEMQALIGKLGLADEDELQSYFIRQISRYVHDRGRKPIGWDEILEGGLAEEATVMSWRGMAGGNAAARTGHDVIMTPQKSVYFDHYQSEDRSREPLAIGGCTTLETVYRFDPVPAELTAPEATHVLGTGAKLWTEYVPTPERAEYMLFPRVCALAEVAWSGQDQHDYGDFLRRLDSHRRHFTALGVTYREWTAEARGA
jgi:hexosaminidase